MANAYNDADYIAARASLKVAGSAVPCWFAGCTRPATTIDHVPALIEHHHIRGAGCCRLLPACQHCNSSDGAAKGNQRRRDGRTLDGDLSRAARRWRG